MQGSPSSLRDFQHRLFSFLHSRVDCPAMPGGCFWQHPVARRFIVLYSLICFASNFLSSYPRNLPILTWGQMANALDDISIGARLHCHGIVIVHHIRRIAVQIVTTPISQSPAESRKQRQGGMQSRTNSTYRKQD